MDQLPLGRLLAAATRMVIEDMHEELAKLGHPGLRPAHGYALVAVGEAGTTAARLATELGMTKQGAAKLVASLEEMGYLRSEAHARDARARLLTLTARGRDLLRRSEKVQSRLERDWEGQAGERNVRALRRTLERAVAERHGEGHPPLRPIW